MVMSQMNTRIDEDVRVRGNLALESIGLTPSQVVRNLWNFAATNSNNPEKLQRTLRAIGKENEPDSEQQTRIAKARQGRRLFHNGLADMGITFPDLDTTSYAELKDRAYSSYWEEKGYL